mmetsp:Transcript_72681/g.222552  ORF Transcript_72681/g.222552 Transcript_72681/m.222552 type:complete len:240 (+) Transcript_72681:110-829(+)
MPVAVEVRPGQDVGGALVAPCPARQHSDQLLDVHGPVAVHVQHPEGVEARVPVGEQPTGRQRREELRPLDAPLRVGLAAQLDALEDVVGQGHARAPRGGPDLVQRERPVVVRVDLLEGLPQQGELLLRQAVGDEVHQRLLAAALVAEPAHALDDRLAHLGMLRDAIALVLPAGRRGDPRAPERPLGGEAGGRVQFAHLHDGDLGRGLDGVPDGVLEGEPAGGRRLRDLLGRLPVPRRVP